MRRELMSLLRCGGFSAAGLIGVMPGAQTTPSRRPVLDMLD